MINLLIIFFIIVFPIFLISQDWKSSFSFVKYDIILNLQNVIFNTSNYSDSIAKINNVDFVYLDPPYAPINSKSFVGYNQTGFSLQEHNKLFDLCVNLKQNNTKFLMSNSDVDLVKNKFSLLEYTTEIIECKRAINSKKPGSKCNEVLIYNYL